MDVPDIGIGTWQNTDPEVCAESVETALELGYRHVDTAQAYGNEGAVGDGLARSSVDRDDVYLATKVWTSNLAPDDVVPSARESLDRLGVDRVDLLYVHWPAGGYDAEDTLAEFERLRDMGLVDDVGVSNFTPEHLEEAVDHADVDVHQFEFHPLLQQHELVSDSRGLGMDVVGYSPLARGDVFELDEVSEVAERQGVSPARVVLAWSLEVGVKPIPKASSRGHIEDNLGALDVDLDDGDLELLEGADERRRLIDPEFAPDW
ncbi:MAG: aldo/keto reductase [Halobacteriota archaeon]